MLSATDLGETDDRVIGLHCRLNEMLNMNNRKDVKKTGTANLEF